MTEHKAKTEPKATTKKKVAKGDAYVCEVCGLAVSVDETCGCVDVCDIICCGKPMVLRVMCRAPIARAQSALRMRIALRVLS